MLLFNNINPKICDDILKIISELNVDRNFYDFIEAYLNYKNKHFKIFEKEFQNQLNDYGEEDVEKKEKNYQKNKYTSYS